MAINLSRNTKVFFTTNVNAATGVFTDSTAGLTASNTFEIQVQDGYSFSQDTQQTSIQVTEAGNAPTRSQRAFNTQLSPVDWSFTTYIRPNVASNFIDAAEKVLWNALLGDATIDGTGKTISALTRASTASPTATVTCSAAVTKIIAGVTSSVVVGDVININGFTETSYNESATILTVPGTGTYTVEYATAPAVTAGTTATTSANTIAYAGQWTKGNTAVAGNCSYVSTMNANKNQLQKFALIFAVDNVVYCVDNCAIDQVSIDFGLDAIASAAWTGKGTALKQLANVTKANLTATATAAASTANYITNKVSTLKLQSNIGGSEFAGSTSYTIPITGGNITIANNLNYLVPNNLAVVNLPIGYYLGQRAITGNVTAYLRTGAGGGVDSGGLLSTMLANSSTTTEPQYKVQLELGGASSANRVEFEMPGVVLQIPAVNVADVVATTINFSAQAFDPALSTQTFDITRNNELIVRYFSS